MIRSLFCIAFLCCYFVVWGQEVAPIEFNIPEIALLDIEPSNSPISLDFPVPGDAGEGFNISEVDDSKYVNYSNGVKASSSRAVFVKIASGKVPEGLLLKVKASTYSGSGSGTTGVPSGELTLNDKSQKIISGIGGSYTGSGNQGHRLTYELALDDITKVDASDSGTTISITYTLLDD